MNNRSRRTGGFTLAELLIVVAIVAVLVAVAIPVFKGELEKSREATDTANIRGQYAEVMATAAADDRTVNLNGSEFAPIQLKQKDEEWQNSGMKDSLGRLGELDGYPEPGGVAWVTYSTEGTNNVVIHFLPGEVGSSGETTTLTTTQTLAAQGWKQSTMSFSDIRLSNGNSYKLVLDKVPEDITERVEFIIVAHNGGNNGNGSHKKETTVVFEPGGSVNVDIGVPDNGNQFSLKLKEGQNVNKTQILAAIQNSIYEKPNKTD